MVISHGLLLLLFHGNSVKLPVSKVSMAVPIVKKMVSLKCLLP